MFLESCGFYNTLIIFVYNNNNKNNNKNIIIIQIIGLATFGCGFNSKPCHCLVLVSTAGAQLANYEYL